MAKDKVEVDEATGQPKPRLVQVAGKDEAEKLDKELGTPDPYVGRTAPAVAAGLSGQNKVAREAREMAEEHGVVDAAYADYETALGNYEARVDVETLAERRARESGISFEDGAFVRRNETQGGVTTSAESAKKKAETPRPSEGPTGKDDSK